MSEPNHDYLGRRDASCGCCCVIDIAGLERLIAELDEARDEVERREFEHDERCESEYESGAHAWTPCGCWASRSEAEGLLARAVVAEDALERIGWMDRLSRAVAQVTPCSCSAPQGADS